MLYICNILVCNCSHSIMSSRFSLVAVPLCAHVKSKTKEINKNKKKGKKEKKKIKLQVVALFLLPNLFVIVYSTWPSRCFIESLELLTVLQEVPDFVWNANLLKFHCWFKNVCLKLPKELLWGTLVWSQGWSNVGDQNKRIELCSVSVLIGFAWPLQ